MNRIIIDNCVISQDMGCDVCIRSIRMEKRIYQTLNFNTIPKLTSGNKKYDNDLISKLASNKLQFEDLVNMLQN